jgi:hypothetical protein
LARESVERVGESGSRLIEALRMQLRVAGEAVEAGGVVVVEPRQIRVEARCVEGSAGTVDGSQRSSRRPGIGVHLRLDCGEPGRHRSVWLPFDVNGGPAQIVEGGLIAAVGGGDECGVS